MKIANHITSEEEIARIEQIRRDYNHKFTYPVQLGLKADDTEWLLIISMFPTLVGEDFNFSLPHDHRRFNCHAHTLQLREWFDADTENWPPLVDRTRTINDFIQAFEKFGFSVCPGDHFEIGWQKICLFANREGFCSHSCRQTPGGKWSSKIGGGPVIWGISLQSTARHCYGDPHTFMRRKIQRTVTA